MSEQYDHIQTCVEHPVFIVGTMRSGTSYLGLELNKAKELIGCPFELRRVWSKYGKVPMASDVIDTACPALEAEDAWPGQKEAMRRALSDEVRKNLNGKILNESSRVLNKNPHLSNKLFLVDQLFPKASYVWTLRNLEDVVCSLKNLFLRPFFKENDCYHIWPEVNGRPRCFSVAGKNELSDLDINRVFPGGDVVHLAEYWLETNRAVSAFFKSLPRARLVSVIHERVLHDSASVASTLERRLCLSPGSLSDMSQTASESSTKDWSFSLSDQEKAQLSAFERSHRDEIQAILAFCNSL